jgi:crotonobetainyl-CoA hydratase
VSDKNVRTAMHGQTLVISIDRPEVLNAIDAATSQALGEALDTADRSPEVRAIIVTGAGDRSFCAGADLKALSGGELPYSPTRPDWGFAGFINHPVSTPVIAAVNGLAIGGGLELMLAADVVVAVRTAKVGLTEVTRGIIASGGGLVRLPQQIPLKIAMELILTGRVVTMEDLAPWGIVNAFVDDAADVLPRALSIAESIAANAPLAVQASKRVALGIIDGRPGGDDARWMASEAETVAVRQSEDAQEGPRAFIERRPPVWKGR